MQEPSSLSLPTPMMTVLRSDKRTAGKLYMLKDVMIFMKKNIPPMQVIDRNWNRRFVSCQGANRPIALTSQILRVSSRCSLTISIRVQQPHTAQTLTILVHLIIIKFYKICFVYKSYIMHRLLICPPDASSPAL
jgi:hypothetical protein